MLSVTGRFLRDGYGMGVLTGTGDGLLLLNDIGSLSLPEWLSYLHVTIPCPSFSRSSLGQSVHSLIAPRTPSIIHARPFIIQTCRSSHTK